MSARPILARKTTTISSSWCVVMVMCFQYMFKKFDGIGNPERLCVFCVVLMYKYFITCSLILPPCTMTTASRFGRLWGRSHETFTPSLRRILSVKGASATTYLQGLVTSDLTTDPTPPISHLTQGDGPPPDDDPVVEFNPNLRSTCFLDNKGRILTDAFLWKQSDDCYLLDVPSDSAEGLLQHLKKFKLLPKVSCST